MISTSALIKLLLSGDSRININIPVETLVGTKKKGVNTRKSTQKVKKNIPFPVRAFILLVEMYNVLEQNLLDELYLLEEEGQQDSLFDDLGLANFDDDEEDDLEPRYAKEDPLNDIDLKKVLIDSVKQICAKEKQLVNVAAQIMTSEQKQILQKIIKL